MTVVGVLPISIMANLMLAFVSGRKLESTLSDLSLIVGIQVVLVKIPLGEFFGGGSVITEVRLILVLILPAAVGILLPLRFLHRAPRSRWGVVCAFLDPGTCQPGK